MSEERIVGDVKLYPVDAVAARVTQRGEAHHRPTTGNGARIVAPPHPPIPVPEDTVNLIGTERGRVTIVAYLGNLTGKGSQHGAAWIGRCQCGRYEIRRGVKWRRGLREGRTDACEDCKHIQTLRRSDEWRRTGKNSGVL